VDDRLYSVGDARKYDSSTENSGKEIEPTLPEKEAKKGRTLGDTLLAELDDEQELAITTKLGQFERQTTLVARAHDISRTAEPDMGMGV
jgi:t-SNARE complex subunit (syntaxin)